MLIEHKGQPYRAIRLILGNYMTSCGNMIPAKDCLVHAQGIWWLNRQIKVTVNENYKNIGIRIPEHPGETRNIIAGVLVPTSPVGDLRNLHCITPP